MNIHKSMNATRYPEKMKAVRTHARGGPENLVYEETEIPSITEGEVMIKVCAASITPTELSWNSSYTDRNGNSRLPSIPSYEISGFVETVGDSVKHLKEGDEVYGLLDFWKNGGAAEYATANAADIALKPATLDHVSAASLPLSGLTAWQALFDHGKLSPGKRVLIHGATGGVGSLAVQLASWKGAYVIGTCSKSKGSLVRQLGADEVLDYNSQNFEDLVGDVDLVMDTVGGETLDRSYQIVEKDGTVVTVADDIKEEQLQKYGINGVSFLVQPDRDELKEIAVLADSGIIKPVIQETFPLKNAKEAFLSGITSHNAGKIVLKVVG